MSKPTPTPWRFEPWHIQEGPSAVLAPEGWIICTTSSDEDAAFIVKCVNSHDALVVALQAVQGRIMNAKIDLQTGHTKAAGVQTLDGIIKFVDDVLVQVPA